MVGIGLVGGILVIQILKAEGILSPKKSSISSSVLNNVVERGDTSALLDNKQREWPEGLKEEVNAAEEMGEKDDDTNIITGKDTNTYHKLLHILKGIAPQKTEAGKGETAAHEKRAAILTGRDVTMVATSPVKTKMRGWDLQMPVVIALVLLLGISLISLSAPDNNNTTLRISVSWGGPESSKSIVLSHSTAMTAPYGYMGGMMNGPPPMPPMPPGPPPCTTMANPAPTTSQGPPNMGGMMAPPPPPGPAGPPGPPPPPPGGPVMPADYPSGGMMGPGPMGMAPGMGPRPCPSNDGANAAGSEPGHQ
ncbi:hypothetical protein O3P69_016006 [Scylla paramamosain]|uniref:Uncharacterized protein n=1 Tax=Scylla paramamosain TaxID=85552 RepID=A0AAW0TBW5_SCYPA